MRDNIEKHSFKRAEILISNCMHMEALLLEYYKWVIYRVQQNVSLLKANGSKNFTFMKIPFMYIASVKMLLIDLWWNGYPAKLTANWLQSRNSLIGKS